ncbi:MAG: hypothetical protein OHK0052_05650 [Anaerolineales bacterium]
MLPNFDQPEFDPQSDLQFLIQGAQDGEEAALLALAERALPIAYTLAFEVLGDSAEAARTARRAVLQALVNLPRYRGKVPFELWLGRRILRAARADFEIPTEHLAERLRLRGYNILDTAYLLEIPPRRVLSALSAVNTNPPPSLPPARPLDLSAALQNFLRDLAIARIADHNRLRALQFGWLFTSLLLLFTFIWAFSGYFLPADLPPTPTPLPLNTPTPTITPTPTPTTTPQGYDPTQADGAASEPALSPDGNWVVFVSAAENLLPGVDQNNLPDIYLRDLRPGGQMYLMSIGWDSSPADGRSAAPQVARDAAFIAFISWATNLVPQPDNHPAPALFLRDVQQAITYRVPFTGSLSPEVTLSLSADGRYLAFDGAPAPANPLARAPYLYDRVTNQLTRLDASSAPEIPADNLTYLPQLSADGKWVAMNTAANNLFPGNANGSQNDVILCPLEEGKRGECRLVSRTPTGESGNAPSILFPGGISGDGRFVVFASQADNLVAEDTNGVEDVFLFDSRTDTVTRLTTGGAPSTAARISANAQVVVLLSLDETLTPNDTNRAWDVYWFHRLTARFERLQPPQGDFHPAPRPFNLSADGRFLALVYPAPLLDRTDANNLPDVFIFDRETVRTLRASAPPVP